MFFRLLHVVNFLKTLEYHYIANFALKHRGADLLCHLAVAGAGTQICSQNYYFYHKAQHAKNMFEN